MFLYDAIFGSSFNNPTDIISAGLICGSVATGIFALFLRIKNGKPLNVDKDVLVVEGIIFGVVKEEKQSETAKNIVNFLLSASNGQEVDTLYPKVVEILKASKTEETTEQNLDLCARLIVKVFFEKD